MYRIKRITGDVYRSKENIIFNPVGVVDNQYGFYNRLKTMYPDVYAFYKEKTSMYSPKELMADIQLVYIKDDIFILNAYCKDANGMINKLALTKTLIETCNLAHEYKISVGIEDVLGMRNDRDRYCIDTIIHKVFEGTDIDIRLYRRFKKYKRG